MKLQVVAVGDAHLHPGPRQEDRVRALQQILSEARQLPQLGAWTVAGDLFHQRSTIEDRNLWADWLVAAADLAPVFVCDGNHDCPGDTAIFGKLKARYPITVVTSPQVVRADVGGRWLTLFVLPYPHPAGLLTQGTAVPDLVAAARPHLEAIFMDAGRQLEEASRRGEPTLFVGHINVAGAIVSTGQPMIGREIELDPALLVRLGDGPKLLNHIHKPQEIAGATFVGSICRLDWGETEEKRYVVIEYESLIEGDAIGPWTWRLTSHPIAVAPMYTVEATYVNQTFVYDIPPETIPPGAEIRVRARFPESERTFFEMGKAHLLADFAHAAKGKPVIEPVCVPDRGLRAPEVAAAKTLYDKLVAWCHVNELEVPDGLKEAVAALEQHDAEQVVAEFSRQMETLLTPAVEKDEVLA